MPVANHQIPFALYLLPLTHYHVPFFYTFMPSFKNEMHKDIRVVSKQGNYTFSLGNLHMYCRGADFHYKTSVKHICTNGFFNAVNFNPMQNYTGHPASLSHNLLVSAGLQQVAEPIVLPVSGLKMQRAHKVKLPSDEVESGWHICPNPASDYLLVTQPKQYLQELAEYALIDQAGRLVQAGVLPAKASCRLQIGSLQAGYYVARFSRSGQVVYQVKLFIQP
jgi:hypothetical protein